MDKYIITEDLGEGSFGKVKKAINKTTNELVAIKIFNQKFQSIDKCKELREVKALTKLHHENIINLIEIILENQKLHLVFEIMKMNLFELLNKKDNDYFFKKENNNIKGLSEDIIKVIFYQILLGLDYMHKNNYFHRDLKPENILLNDNNIVKIADFGLSREIRSIPPFTQYVSTRWYRAPECLLESSNYSYPIDIWALACIIIELITGLPIFPGTNNKDMLNKVTFTLGTPNTNSEISKLAKKMNYKFMQINSKQDLKNILPNNISERLLNILKSMLQWDPFNRPNTKDLLNNEYFQFFKLNNLKEIININENGSNKDKNENLDISNILENSLEYNMFINKIKSQDIRLINHVDENVYKDSKVTNENNINENFHLDNEENNEIQNDDYIFTRKNIGKNTLKLINEINEVTDKINMNNDKKIDEVGKNINFVNYFNTEAKQHLKSKSQTKKEFGEVVEVKEINEMKDKNDYTRNSKDLNNLNLNRKEIGPKTRFHLNLEFNNTNENMKSFGLDNDEILKQSLTSKAKIIDYTNQHKKLTPINLANKKLLNYTNSEIKNRFSLSTKSSKVKNLEIENRTNYNEKENSDILNFEIKTRDKSYDLNKVKLSRENIKNCKTDQKEKSKDVRENNHLQKIITDEDTKFILNMKKQLTKLEEKITQQEIIREKSNSKCKNKKRYNSTGKRLLESSNNTDNDNCSINSNNKNNNLKKSNNNSNYDKPLKEERNFEEINATENELEIENIPEVSESFKSDLDLSKKLFNASNISENKFLKNQCLDDNKQGAKITTAKFVKNEANIKKTNNTNQTENIKEFNNESKNKIEKINKKIRISNDKKRPNKNQNVTSNFPFSLIKPTKIVQHGLNPTFSKKVLKPINKKIINHLTNNQQVIKDKTYNTNLNDVKSRYLQTKNESHSREKLDEKNDKNVKKTMSPKKNDHSDKIIKNHSNIALLTQNSNVNFNKINNTDETHYSDLNIIDSNYIVNDHFSRNKSSNLFKKNKNIQNKNTSDNYTNSMDNFSYFSSNRKNFVSNFNTVETLKEIKEIKEVKEKDDFIIKRDFITNNIKEKNISNESKNNQLHNALRYNTSNHYLHNNTSNEKEISDKFIALKTNENINKYNFHNQHIDHQSSSNNNYNNQGINQKLTYNIQNTKGSYKLSKITKNNIKNNNEKDIEQTNLKNFILYQERLINEKYKLNNKSNDLSENDKNDKNEKIENENKGLLIKYTSFKRYNVNPNSKNPNFINNKYDNKNTNDLADKLENCTVVLKKELGDRINRNKYEKAKSALEPKEKREKVNEGTIKNYLPTINNVKKDSNNYYQINQTKINYARDNENINNKINNKNTKLTNDKISPFNISMPYYIKDNKNANEKKYNYNIKDDYSRNVDNTRIIKDTQETRLKLSKDIKNLTHEFSDNENYFDTFDSNDEFFNENEVLKKSYKLKNDLKKNKKLSKRISDKEDYALKESKLEKDNANIFNDVQNQLIKNIKSKIAN